MQKAIARNDNDTVFLCCGFNDEIFLNSL